MLGGKGARLHQDLVFSHWVYHQHFPKSTSRHEIAKPAKEAIAELREKVIFLNVSVIKKKKVEKEKIECLTDPMQNLEKAHAK